MIKRSLACLVSILIVSSTCRDGRAGFVETWEAPRISPGSSSTSLPSPWVSFSGGGNAKILAPNTTGDFNQVGPLASPAGGSQLLSLTGVNTGISMVTNEIIRPDTTYTLSAAIGNGLRSRSSMFWSLQLWAGSVGDTFIGQRFGTQVDAINATPGDWAFNSYSYSVPSTSSLVGKRLVVFLNNFGDGTSYYDNVSLTVVPEPSSIALVLIGGMSMAVGRITKRRGRRADAERN